MVLVAVERELIPEGEDPLAYCQTAMVTTSALSKGYGSLGAN
jgi:hypothetical protein